MLKNEIEKKYQFKKKLEQEKIAIKRINITYDMKKTEGG
jgi:hypothetical protein